MMKIFPLTKYSQASSVCVKLSINRQTNYHLSICTCLYYVGYSNKQFKNNEFLVRLYKGTVLLLII